VAGEDAVRDAFSSSPCRGLALASEQARLVFARVRSRELLEQTHERRPEERQPFVVLLGTFRERNGIGRSERIPHARSGCERLRRRARPPGPKRLELIGPELPKAAEVRPACAAEQRGRGRAGRGTRRRTCSPQA
jgi:hypothetical protein